jgi:hypothetical protein
MQIAGADLVTFEQQIVELNRLVQRRGRGVGKPRALLAGRAIEQIDHDTVCQFLRAPVRIAEVFDQPVDRIDNVRAEELRQDQITVPIPCFLLLSSERLRATAGRSTDSRQSHCFLHHRPRETNRILGDLSGGSNISR